MSSQSAIPVDVAYLLSLDSIRDRSHALYSLARTDSLDSIHLHLDRLPAVIDRVCATIDRDYASPRDVPAHSRWRHFDVGGRRRIEELICAWEAEAGVDWKEVTRRLLDVFMVSVLVDAGAGDMWKYAEEGSDAKVGRSEGLALASLDMFRIGAFSCGPLRKHQVDAGGLEGLTVDALTHGFQVSAENPLVGLEGRCRLLNQLGTSLKAADGVFGMAGSNECRPGNLLDYLIASSSPTSDGKHSVSIDALWSIISTYIFPIFPSETHLHGVPLGDVHPVPALAATNNPAGALIPFHKLSQWLTYSLIEAIERGSKGAVTVHGVGKMTGLPEYRNGGLLLDLGVMSLKATANARGIARAKADLAAGTIPMPAEGEPLLPRFTVSDSAIVEWRALTVILLDMVAVGVRKRYAMTADELPLCNVLEGGTWKCGREVAAERRPVTRGPPIGIVSDGTVF